tara:strand:+ start:614 stop:1201 length:588 start_codon:yes stop_codon:yes gene_type:complete
MSIKNLFTVPIYETKLDLDTDKLRLFCIEHKIQNEGVMKSNVGGYQSNRIDVDFDECLRPLFEEVVNHATKFANIFLANDGKQKMNYAWYNINYYKDNNKSHTHPVFCDIASVYYVKTPENCGVIQFENPAKRELEFTSRGIIPESWNAYNSRTWWLPVSENTLYLFPCWLSHYVEPNNNKDEERISFSLNTVGE